MITLQTGIAYLSFRDSTSILCSNVYVTDKPALGFLRVHFINITRITIIIVSPIEIEVHMAGYYTVEKRKLTTAGVPSC